MCRPTRRGELRNLTAFLREQGAELGAGVVVDVSQIGQYLGTDASVPVVTRYPRHPITETLSSLSAFPIARPVQPIADGGRVATSIVMTGDQTWSESDTKQLGSGRLSMLPEKGDRPGPLSLAVAVSRPAVAPSSGHVRSREARLVAVGDSDFVANHSANVPGNTEIFLSMTRWLTGDDEIRIPARFPQARTLTMTPAQRRNVSWVVCRAGAARACAGGGGVYPDPQWMNS